MLAIGDINSDDNESSSPSNAKEAGEVTHFRSMGL